MVSYGSWVVLVVLDVASGLCSARPTDFDHPILRVLCENVLGEGKYIKKAIKKHTFLSIDIVHVQHDDFPATSRLGVCFLLGDTQ